MAVKFDLTDQSREAVMDASPWIVRDRLGRDAARGQDRETMRRRGINTIADPRRFVYVEACGTIGNAALARLGRQRPVAVGGVSRTVISIWTASDRGLPQYRIVRDGCFRIATPLPGRDAPSDIRAIRVHAFERPPADGAAPAAAESGAAHADQQGVHARRALPAGAVDPAAGKGRSSIAAGGEPFEVRIP